MATMLGAPAFLGNKAVFTQSRMARVTAPAPLQTFAVKKWVKQPLTDNGKPVRVKMHVKSGDTVVVTAGKDKGKVSTVEQVLTKTGKLIVKDVNMITKHVKPRSAEEAGQIINREAPIHHSNVMHWSAEKSVRSRVTSRVNASGVKERVLVKTGEVLAEKPYVKKSTLKKDDDTDASA